MIPMSKRNIEAEKLWADNAITSQDLAATLGHQLERLTRNLKIQGELLRDTVAERNALQAENARLKERERLAFHVGFRWAWNAAARWFVG